MKRITQITISNYRAFFNEEGKENKYQINLPLGENLLIYGENGSGKSSLFKAMVDFFLSTKNQFPIENNIFTETKTNLPDSLIKIVYSDNSVFEFNRLNCTAYKDSFFNNTTTAFLTYKDILNTYYLDIYNKKFNPNLFDLFVNNLLRHLTDASGNQKIQTELEKLRNQVNTFNRAYNESIKGITDKDQKDDLLNNLKAVIIEKQDELNKTLSSHFLPVLKKVNYYLEKYFKFNLQVSLKNLDRYLTLSFKGPIPKLNESLYLNLKFYGRRLKYKAYQSFLNEARLSALALTVYFSALKIESERVANQNIKFFFLDDIFIGLDTCNRIPLLEILNSDFKEFQIFITTYDRNWFEVSKRWFANSTLKFKIIELYVNNSRTGNNTFDIPIIIDPSLSYFERAKLYFEKLDYPAAANYLRKACENELKRILPQNLLLIEKKESGEIKAIQEVGKLFENFKKYGHNNNLDMSNFKQFETYTKIVFNSLSHDDINAPHFKKEIEDGIKLVQSLNKIKSKQLLKTDNPTLKVSLWKNGDVSKTLHHYEIKLLENLYFIQQDSLNAVFSNTRCELITPTTSIKQITFNDALKRILTEEEYNYTNEIQSLCKKISINSHKKLYSILNFS